MKTILLLLLLLLLIILLQGCGEYDNAKLASIANKTCSEREGTYKIRWDTIDGIIYCNDGYVERIPNEFIQKYTNADVKIYLEKSKEDNK